METIIPSTEKLHFYHQKYNSNKIGDDLIRAYARRTRGEMIYIRKRIQPGGDAKDTTDPQWSRVASILSPLNPRRLQYQPRRAGVPTFFSRFSCVRFFNPRYNPDSRNNPHSTWNLHIYTDIIYFVIGRARSFHVYIQGKTRGYEGVGRGESRASYKGKKEFFFCPCTIAHLGAKAYLSRSVYTYVEPKLAKRENKKFVEG